MQQIWALSLFTSRARGRLHGLQTVASRQSLKYVRTVLQKREICGLNFGQ